MSLDLPGVRVKKEVECEPACGVSEAAARAGLYADHEVKDELVLGPEVLLPQDIAYTRATLDQGSPEDVKQEPLPLGALVSAGCARVRLGEDLLSIRALQRWFSLRPCSVRLQRYPVHKKPDLRQLNKEKSAVMQKQHRHKCKTCPKTFAFKSRLLRHSCIQRKKKKPKVPKMKMTCHSNIRKKNFKCDTCSKEYSLKFDLIDHINSHTGSEPYACEVCSKKFASRRVLMLHTYTHVEDREAFPCEICEKKFSQEKYLNRHILLHTGRKPHLPGL